MRCILPLCERYLRRHPKITVLFVRKNLNPLHQVNLSQKAVSLKITKVLTSSFIHGKIHFWLATYPMVLLRTVTL